MAYATLAQVREYLSITTSADDALLTNLIARAQSAINAQTAREFESVSDVTKLFDAVRDVSDDRRTLYITADLAQITSVTNGDGVAVSASAYVRRPEGLKLKASTGLLWTYTTDPEDAISITGRWAYSLSAPPDIQHACIRLAAYFYRQRSTQNEVSAVEFGNDGAVAQPSVLPADVMALIKPYRKTTP